MPHRERALAFESVTPILSVVDLEAALTWYQHVLGFERAWSWGTPTTLASVCRGNVELNLGLRGQMGPPGPSQVYLRVSPVDVLWERMLAAGAEVKAPIADREYGLRDFSVRDASGNVLDFGEPIAAPPATER